MQIKCSDGFSISDEDAGAYVSSRCIRQALLLATVRAKDILCLQAIVERKEFNANEIFDFEEETCNALFMTLAHKWHHGLRVLIDFGDADVNLNVCVVDSIYGTARRVMTPLQVAIIGGDLASVEMLLAAGANATFRDPLTGVSPMYLAVRGNWLDIARCLLRWSPTPWKDVNVLCSDYLSTPLFAALTNMGFRQGALTAEEPYTRVSQDRWRQQTCLTVAECLLREGADMMLHPTGMLPLPFLCATPTDERFLVVLLRYGLDVNTTACMPPRLQPMIVRGLHGDVISQTTNVSLLTYYIGARCFNVARLLVGLGAQVAEGDRQLIIEFFLAGQRGTVSHAPLPSSSRPHIEQLYHHVTQPRDLMSLCRNQIRIGVGLSKEGMIDELPLPKATKQFLEGYDLFSS